MDDNGELKTQKEKAWESSLGSAPGDVPVPEKIKGQIETEGKSVSPPTDFKIAEIWFRNGQLMLDASQEFWKDKFRARGVIAYLDDIVKEAKVPNARPKVIPAKNSMLNFARKIFRKR